MHVYSQPLPWPRIDCAGILHDITIHPAFGKINAHSAIRQKLPLAIKSPFELSMVAADLRREEDRDRGVIEVPIAGISEPLRYCVRGNLRCQCFRQIYRW